MASSVTRREDDPVLGTATVYSEIPFMAGRRVATGVLAMASFIFLAWLGASGYQPDLAHNAALLRLWPLAIPLAALSVVATILWAIDATRPRCVELRIGQNGFSVTIGAGRNNYLWSAVRSVEREEFSYWLGRFGVRVRTRHDGDMHFRTDVLGNSRLIAWEMSDALKRWNDAK